MKVRPATNTCPDRIIASELLRDEPAFLSSLDFGPFVRQGKGPGPRLLMGDSSEIALLSETGGSGLEYRMALLARPGDHVLVRRRHRDFEDYLARYLGLSDVTYHEADADSPVPLAKQIWANVAWVELFADVVRASGGLTVQPYLTTGHTWRLAQAIGTRARRAVHVCGPSPRISQRANDKLWFARLARRVLGSRSTPPTLSAFGPTATAGLVHHILKHNDQAIVKVPDSAGSAGNLRLDAPAWRHASISDLRSFLLGRLHALGWHDSYPVLVGVWDTGVTCSPSAQIWVPLASDGPPRVEGIFEQHVKTSAATFVGAVRSGLPAEVQAKLVIEARRIAEVLQTLGYFGRCSLDAVLCNAGAQPPTVHWIECNARWGGVSIPMTALVQLGLRQPNGAIAIVQERQSAQDLNIRKLERRLGDHLLRLGGDEAGVVVLSPPDTPKGPLLNLATVAPHQEVADGLMDDALTRLAVAGPA